MAESGPNAGPDPETSLPGLTNAHAAALERSPIRTRESRVTLSGWQLSVESDQGKGVIVRVEAGPGEARYRGEGVFLGWTEEQLRKAYESLRPRTAESALETQQLG